VLRRGRILRCDLHIAEDALREEITRLMSLQAIDRELRELQIALATVSGRSIQLRQEALDYAAELERLQQEDLQSVIARRNLEKELAECEARGRNKRMRSNQVRNDREQLAVDHEIESIKETKQRLESELLTMMEAADQRTARIKVLVDLSDQRRRELIEAEKETAAQVEDLKISISKQHVDRDLMTKNIEPALLQRYEIIFSRRAGVAVAQASGGTCQGCRMRLPPQLYNEIQKHLQVHFCPNCQRILYFEAAAKVE
jgi:predicted  nucleic acid-binding Zn-ribbon protein